MGSTHSVRPQGGARTLTLLLGGRAHRRPPWRQVLAGSLVPPGRLSQDGSTVELCLSPLCALVRPPLCSLLFQLSKVPRTGKTLVIRRSSSLVLLSTSTELFFHESPLLSFCFQEKDDPAFIPGKGCILTDLLSEPSPSPQRPLPPSI